MFINARDCRPPSPAVFRIAGAGFRSAPCPPSGGPREVRLKPDTPLIALARGDELVRVRPRDADGGGLAGGAERTPGGAVDRKHELRRVPDFEDQFLLAFEG